MERRLRWWFVPAYVLVWFVGLFVGTVTLIAFYFSPWPLAAVTDSSYLEIAMPLAAATAAGRLVGVFLEALLVGRAVPGIRFPVWLAFSFAGMLLGTVVGGSADLVTDILLASGAVVSGNAESSDMFSVMTKLPGTMLFGLSLGALQGVVLARSGYAQARWRWVVMSACGWGVYAATRGVGWAWLAGNNPASANVDLVGFVNFVATFIPGLILGLALKRIVESQPAPAAPASEPIEG